MHKQENKHLLWRFLKGSKAMFFFAMIFTAITALADMIIPQIVRFTVDSIIGGEPSDMPKFILDFLEKIGGREFLKVNLWVMSIAIIIVAVVKLISHYSFRVLNTKATETFSKTARDGLFSHIARLPYEWHKKNKTGDIIQRCTSDLATMKDFVSEELSYLLRIISMVVLSLVFMANMNIPLTLIALTIFPIIMINSVIFDKKIERDFQSYEDGEGKLSATVQENLTGVRVVRAFGRERSEQEKFERQNEDYTNRAKKLGVTFGYFDGASDILSGLQVMCVIIFGAVFCVKGSMTAGEYIAFVSYNTMLTFPLNELGRIITEMGKAGVSLRRIKYVMNSEQEPILQSGKKPDLNQDIEFKNVTFSYEKGAPVLNNVTFSMKGGSTLGILGGTGSGKSTLMMLLDKIYTLKDGCGSITVGGVDIKEIDTEYLRKNIGMVLQDPYLFSGTIAENIAISDDRLEFEQVKMAAKSACLDDTVSNFSKGYDTFVGERGVTLSGGQKQRVAIARVLVNNKPIMIFDDSLSAVDMETDLKIRSALEAKFGSASIIIISHRIATLSKADKILVVEKGQIIESGNHDELLKENGLYKKIYDIQTGGKENLK